jgi:sugar/nucleoside kinase (ribokinase family)
VTLLICGGIFVEEIADHSRRLGGSGFTAAIAAARHGARVSLAGWIGEAEADEAFALLDDAGVDRLGVRVLNGSTTTYRISDPADLAAPMPSVIEGAVPRDTTTPALPAARVVLNFGTPGFDAIRAGWLDRATQGATLLFDRQGSHSMILGGAMAATVPAARRILIANVFEVCTETKQSDLASSMRLLPTDGFAATIVKAGPWGVTVVEPNNEETSFGTHEVVVANTIGSGDVFAGTLAAHLAAGTELAASVPRAIASAVAWISSGADQPPPDLPERAAAVAVAPAIWVDRRQLEAKRFDAAYDADLNKSERQRVSRGLRYLGMETMYTARDEVLPLDLVRPGIPASSNKVTTAITTAIAHARDEIGLIT